MIWETILSNVFHYDFQMLSRVKYVTSPLPETIILATRARQQFAGVCLFYIYIYMCVNNVCMPSFRLLHPVFVV